MLNSDFQEATKQPALPLPLHSSFGRRRFTVVILFAVMFMVCVPMLTVFSAPAALADNLSLDPNMSSTWQRTDLPIAQGKVSRSWLWGPQVSHIVQENYADAPGGKRLVAYYDKTRMEVTNPNGDRSSKWFVTNGLLVKEMISGQRQDGDNQFTTIIPADIPVAGDPGNAGPTYASFKNVSSIDPTQHRSTDMTGQTIINTITKDGTAGQDLTMSNYSVKVGYYDSTLGHNIPAVFWSFMNSTGMVYQNGAYVNGAVVDWTYSTGYPLSEAYWAKVTVAGKQQDVLIQPFQRRVLTYTPANPAAYRVEMGNVGQHYYQWRYQLTQPLTCSFAPISGFGKVWGNNLNVQLQLGCPYYHEEGLTINYLPFQNGAMYQIDLSQVHDNRYIFDTYGLGDKIVLVTFNDDHSWTLVKDDWNSSMPHNGGFTPPAGLYEPQDAFGKVWRDGTALHIRDRLGWATASAGQSTNSALEQFYYGGMFYVGATKTIYALYNPYYNQVHNWDSFADTNTGSGQ